MSARQHKNAFPTKQLAILALCRVAEPISMCSIFPYVYQQVNSFLPAGSKYLGALTGILIAAFPAVQTFSSKPWGRISDRYGRKPCLIFGLCGSLLSLILYGFAGSIGLAIFARGLGGILNGNVGVMQTMVGEIAVHKEHQPKAFSVLPFVWAIGSIAGPAIGGGLASPHNMWPKQFPEGSIFQRFPYAPPNLLCAALVLASIIFAVGWMEETHVAFKGRRDVGIELRKYITGRIFCNSGKNTDEANQETERTALLSAVADAQSYLSVPSVESPTEESEGFFEEKADDSGYPFQVWLWIIAYGILSYHANAFEHLLPIMLQLQPSSEKQWWLLIPSGLGFSSQLVGILYFAQGIFSCFVQLFFYPWITGRIGVHKTFVWGCITYPILYFVIPYIVCIPYPLYWPFVVVILACKMVWECCIFPCLFILMSNSVVDKRRMGSVNGTAAAVAAATKAVGPSLSGLVFDWGISHRTLAAPWFLTGFVAIAGGAICYLLKEIPREEASQTLFVDETLEVEAAAEAAAAVAAMAIPMALATEEGPAHAAALLATSVKNGNALEEMTVSKKDAFDVTSRELTYESDSSEDGGRKLCIVLEEEDQPE